MTGIRRRRHLCRYGSVRSNCSTHFCAIALLCTNSLIWRVSPKQIFLLLCTFAEGHEGRNWSPLIGLTFSPARHLQVVLCTRITYKRGVDVFASLVTHRLR